GFEVAPRQGEYEPVQCQGRQGVRGRTRRRDATGQYAAGDCASADSGCAEEPRAGTLYLPDQRGGSTRPEVRIPASATGNPIGLYWRSLPLAAAAWRRRLSPALRRYLARLPGRLAPARLYRDTYSAGFPGSHRRLHPPIHPRD